MSSQNIDYTPQQMIVMVCERHVNASAQYLKDKDYPKYQKEEQIVKSALERNNIPIADYWAYVMRK